MSTNRLSNIDIMRGFAALLVVWQHSSENLKLIPEIAVNGTLLADLAWQVDFGRIGVICFFLISGFVIPFSFSTDKTALKKFAIRRFFRLYPVYWLSIALALLTTFLFAGTLPNSSTIVANATMLQSFFGQPHIQGLYWTLQIEVIFYLLCAGFYKFGILNNPRHQLKFSLLFLALFCLVSISARKIPVLQGVPKEILYIPYVLAIMFSGTILRTLLTKVLSKREMLILSLAPVAVFGMPTLIFVLHLLNIDIVGQAVKFFFGHLLGLAMFLGGFLFIKTARLPLIWLGTVSYSVYLFHPIAITLTGWLRQQEWAAGVSTIHMGFYMLLDAIVTLLLASIVYILVERPSINTGYRLTNSS